MSAINLIEVPKWGLSMDEATIAEWLIEEGSPFRKGDPICALETSKILNELEAPFDGCLRRVIAHSGETVQVGAPIAVSAEASVTDAEIDQFVGGLNTTDGFAQRQSAEPADDPAAVKARSAAVEPGVVPSSLRGQTDVDVFATPRAIRMANDLSIDLARVTGSGAGGRVSVADVEEAIRAAGGSVAAVPLPKRSMLDRRSMGDDSAVFATPVARKLAASLGIDLNDCRATGGRGRVCMADVREAESRLNQGASTTAYRGESETLSHTVEFETIPLNVVRKSMGRRLQASKQNAPHFRVCVDLDLDNVLLLRQQINQTVPTVKLSVNDFIVKATAAALIKVPDVNVHYDEDARSIRRYIRADISVAVAAPSGLITPVVRAADTKTLAEVSAEMKVLSTKAKTGMLTLEDLEGGTFTISNLGMFGVRNFDAIINPPQCAILAVGTGQQRPVVVDGQVVSRTLASATLSCDHRVIDGALGASFLNELRRYVESPALMLV